MLCVELVRMIRVEVEGVEREGLESGTNAL